MEIYKMFVPVMVYIYIYTITTYEYIYIYIYIQSLERTLRTTVSHYNFRPSAMLCGQPVDLVHDSGQPTVTLCGQLAMLLSTAISDLFIPSPPSIYFTTLNLPTRSIFVNRHKIWETHGALRQWSVSLWPTLSCDIEKMLTRLPAYYVITM